MDKGELLFEIKEKPTAVILKEFLQDGAKIQYNSTGQVKGKYSGGHLETADVFQKMDGTNEWEVRAMETTKDGDVVMATGKGTGKQESPTTGSFQGEVTYMTMSKKLNWLNSKKAWVEGTTNQATSEANIKVYAMKQP